MIKKIIRSYNSYEKALQQKILFWYEKNKRDLPWRRTTDPYKILVSEVMLQQTQVDRVIPYYERWLKAFPDFKTLAIANIQVMEIFKYLTWKGRINLDRY